MRRIASVMAGPALAFAFVVSAAAAAPSAAVVPADPAPAGGTDSDTPASFEHVPADAGVSNPVVYAIQADRTGFLWFGTMYGLVRFDGREYRTFRHDPYDSTSLSHDDVVSITEDSLGDLWIGTWGGGADRYDRARGRFDRFLPDGPDSTSLSDGVVWGIACTSDGAAWLATGRGLDRLDPATGRIRHHRTDPKDPGSLAPGAVRAVLQRRSGSLWAGTFGGGLDSLDAASGRFIHHRHDPNDPASLPSDRVTAMHEDRNGRLWIGTIDGGAAILAPGRASFERVARATGFSDDLASPAVQAIYEDPDGTIWLGTMRGLERIDPARREVRHYVPDPGDPGSLRGGNVAAIGRDRSGALWVASYLSGLDRLVPRPAPCRGVAPLVARLGARGRDVQALCEDAAGTIWIGATRGLFAWRRDADDLRTWTPGRPAAGDLPGGRVRALAQSRDGTIWVGTESGLWRWDERIRRFAPPLDRAGERSIQAPVTALLVGRDDRLWVGTEAGLFRLGKDRRDVARFTADATSTASLPDGTILSLYEDRAGRLWVGTYRGLARLDPGADGFVRFIHDPRDPRSLESNYVYALHESADGALWLGTAGGLDRFDEKTRFFEHFREREGLPSPVVVSLVADGSGALWLGTQRGLARFDPATKRVARYDLADGLGNTLFHPGAALRLRDGTLLFGGPEGVDGFRPDLVPEAPAPPPVLLTDFRVPGRAAPAALDASRLHDVRLSARENFFTFQFAALDFLPPGRTRCEYRLEGLDPAWVDVGAGRVASYTSVPPGRYVFRVRASNAAGVPGPDALAIDVVVEPPFWRTPSFAAIVLLALFGGALGTHRALVRARVSRALDVARAREDEREAVRRRAAEDFHDELGHRLARIGLFAEILERRPAKAAEDVDAYLARIASEARRLADEARDFFWSLGAERGSLGELVARLERFGQDLFERTGVEFRVEGRTGDLDAVELPAETRRNLVAVFKEAMTNALRHASCRQVTLRAGVRGGELAIALEDDGCGFLRTAAAAGHGLRNMELRARKIEGDFSIVSEPGGGTRVALTRRVAPAAS
ncbi:MAG: two-component regulator propeller domain-containing protein [bacterium]